MRRTHATTEKANRPIWASRVAIERVSRSMGFELEGSFLNALEGVVRTVWPIYQCIGLACVPPGRCTLCLGVRQVESRMELRLAAGEPPTKLSEGLEVGKHLVVHVCDACGIHSD